MVNRGFSEAVDLPTSLNIIKNKIHGQASQSHPQAHRAQPWAAARHVCSAVGSSRCSSDLLACSSDPAATRWNRHGGGDLRHPTPDPRRTSLELSLPREEVARGRERPRWPCEATPITTFEAAPAARERVGGRVRSGRDAQLYVIGIERRATARVKGRDGGLEGG